MADMHLSIAWDAHQKSICNGLSVLQQRGEFVDMTLAADGHYVKVHQMVMSLVSPYIKDLISSLHCPHPVIFLSNISYTTLCSMLEYIYTGEVLLPRDKVSDLLAAGRALHIKGLKDMDANFGQPKDTDVPTLPPMKTLTQKIREYREKKLSKVRKKRHIKHNKPNLEPVCKVFVDADEEEQSGSMDLSDTLDISQSLMPPIDEDRTNDDNNTNDDTEMNETADTSTTPILETNSTQNEDSEQVTTVNMDLLKPKDSSKIQYSLSNQGTLQIIVNRFVYSFKYLQKSQRKVWRCTDSSYRKCPAVIYTNDEDHIVRRLHNHTHTFHDKRIIKKISLGLVFSHYEMAENHRRTHITPNKKSTSNNSPPPSSPPPTKDSDSD